MIYSGRPLKTAYRQWTSLTSKAYIGFESEKSKIEDFFVCMLEISNGLEAADAADWQTYFPFVDDLKIIRAIQLVKLN